MTNIINRGDIYFAELKNYDEKSQVQCGLRPVLIVSNEHANRSNILSVLAMTSRCYKASHMPTHIFISKEHSGLSRDSIVLCEQPISIDTYVLKNKIGTLSSEQMRRVDDGLRIQLDL